MTEVIDPSTEPDEPAEAPDGGRRKRQKGRRRITFWIGLGLILAGLGILAWLAWEIWGTTWISQRAERREVCKFVANSTGQPEALLEIPALGTGSSTPCGTAGGSTFVVPINDMPLPPGDPSDVLSKGVGHFTGTGPNNTSIGPGEIGNYALAGHRITHGQPFANLPNLVEGDVVYVITHKWTYEYVMDTNAKDLNVPFTSSWVLGMDPVNPSGGPQAIQGPNERIITLTTCSELFHTDNRMIAFGHLLKKFPTNQQNPTRVPAQ